MNDDAQYFVDNCSRVDTAPHSELRNAAGELIANLETTDVSALLANGFKYPEPFQVKADDGITDLYGVMYKPFDFDPRKRYPVIEYVYPGPQTEAVSKTFSPRSANVALAQMGFIVIEVGNRGGSPQRSKWYHNFGYGNLRDYGLADKKRAVEELALKYPWIDTERVGSPVIPVAVLCPPQPCLCTLISSKSLFRSRATMRITSTIAGGANRTMG
jgi:dipeptidyl aminopeptidase/acylaminoacyl peptidase